MRKATHRLISLGLVFLFVSSPLLAQQRRSAAPKKPPTTEAPEPVPTFDKLLAADSYKVYCEVRGVGGLIRASAVNDLVDPVMKLGGPPKEFKAMVKWADAHAEVLAGSRMLVAGWPSNPKLPAVLVAIEFSSAEEAKKFYPELRDFLPTLLPTPTPTPTPTPALVLKLDGTNAPVADQVLVPAPVRPELRTVPEQQPTPELPPYQMKLTGSLIFISPTAFTLRSLRPRNSKLLAEDQNFLLARNRFASESIFLYVDVKSIEKEENERRQKWEDEEKIRLEEEAKNPPKAEESPNTGDPEMAATTAEEQLPPPPEPEPSPTSEPTLVAPTPDPQAPGEATLSGSPRGTDEVSPMFFSLYGALFGGESKWPEAVAAALVFEGDAYVLRTLILNGEENKNSAIPFVPQFVSGPALVPESPNIFPADIDLFVSASLDYPQIYEGMVKAIATAEEQYRKYRTQPVKDGPPPESPFAMYEKKLGLKIKDDLLPLLGHEMALVLWKKPAKAPVASNAIQGDPNAKKLAAENEAKKNEAATPIPIIAISVKDKEAVGRLIPKIIGSFGFKGADLLAETEKRDGAEITSYANVFAYAFVGDFLVLSPDPAATRHVVDSYLSHETLSSNSHFRNFTRWQPRQVLGQVYVGPGLVEQYTSGSSGPFVSDKMSEYLTRVSPVIDPLTYALTNDGLGPLHELHVPKNLLQLIIAGASSEAGQQPLRMNEAMAQTALRSVAASEASYKADEGDGRYGTLAELLSKNLINKELLENYGYRIELTISGDRFEATAVPLNYGTTGRLSYFIDESNLLRGGDHAGGAATLADSPVH